MRRLLTVFAALSVLATAASALRADVSPGPGEILIRGIIKSVDLAAGRMEIGTIAVRMPGQNQDTLLGKTVEKPVNLSRSTVVSLSTGRPGGVKDLVLGAEVVVVGKNLGRGQVLPARSVTVYLPAANPASAASTGTTEGPPSRSPRELGPAESGRITLPLKWTTWDDPAGFRFSYPEGWRPSAAVGANPIVFQRGNLVLEVRRLPVGEGSTPEARAAQAAAGFLSTSTSKGWHATESTNTIGGAKATVILARGAFSGKDIAEALGANPQSAGDIGQGMVELGYIAVPANPGRENWALELGVGGPDSKASELYEVFSTVARSLTWARQETREPPHFNTPLHAANMVQIENTLKQVGTAIQMYFTDNNDVVPPNWQAMASYLGGSAEMMKNLTKGWPEWNVGPVQLLQPGKRVSQLGDPSSVAIARVEAPGQWVVLYADGHVSRERAQPSH